MSEPNTTNTAATRTDWISNGTPRKGWRTGIAYYRISDDPLHDELGVRRQQREVRAKAQAERINIVSEYVDDDRSAFTRKRRPGYENFLQHAGSVDVVLAWHPDRMTRGDLIEIERLVVALGGDEGTPIATCKTGDYDVSTPHGRMIARVTGSIARYESEHRSERLKAKGKEMAEDGRAHGGRRAFGYTSTNDIDTVEAGIIRDAIDRLLAGGSMREIAADLNSRGVTTSTGKEWHPTALRQVLGGTRIAGIRTHHGEAVAKGTWKPIISEATHRRVLATLAERAPVGRRGRTPWLLTGVLFCERCGNALVGNVDAGGGTRRYVCRPRPGHAACGSMAIKAEPVDELVSDMVQRRLANVTARKEADTGPDDEAERAELDAIAAKRIEVADDYAAGGSREAKNSAMAALDRRQRDIETRLAAKVRDTAPLDFVVSEGLIGRPWTDLTVADRRLIVRAVIERIDVGPAIVRCSHRFEAERITAGNRITWRG